MRKYHTNIEELIVAATCYLQQQSFSEDSIGKYCSTWNQLKEFMKLQQLQIFNAVVSEKFLISKLGNYEYEKLSSHYKHLVRRVTVLTEFQETGSVLKKRINRETELTGPIGSMMSGFIAHNAALGFSESTLHNHRLYLSRFLDYLKVNEMISLEMINQIHLVTFANEYGNNKPTVKHCMLSVIRGLEKPNNVVLRHIWGIIVNNQLLINT